jgi:nitroreductase
MNDPLLSRRTIRKYSDRDITEDELNYILKAATRASNTGNMQVYSIVVTRDKAMKELLAPAHFNQKMVAQAPVMLTFCADFNRFNKWCRQRKAEPGYDNFLSFVTAAIDAIIVAQTACMAAESKGMGICYLGTATYMADKIIDILHLPAGVVPVTAVTIGWPDETPEQPDRLALEAVVHREVYNDYSPEMIDSIYAAKEARDDSAKFIAENGKETLAQVFTDVRYKKADNIHFSKSFLEVLRKQGFIE